MRKVLCLVCVLVLLLGCVSSALADEKIKLRIVTGTTEIDAGNYAVLQKRIELFNELYGDEIELEVETIAGEADMTEKMKVYLSTDQLPDVGPGGSNLCYDLAAAGVTWDLDPYVDADEEIKAGLTEKGRAKNTYDGKLFAVAEQSSWMWMFANKDLFDKAGVDTVFEDWDDFWATLDALKASGIEYPVAMETAGNAWTSSLYLGGFISAVSQEGFDYMNTSYPETYDYDFVREGIGNVVRLLRDYAAPDAIGGNYATAEGHFMREEAALIINGTWVISHFSNPELVSDEHFAEKIVNVAFPGNVIYKSAQYGDVILSKDQEHADAAWKWVRLGVTADMQAYRLEKCAVLPDSPFVTITDDIKELYPALADAYEKFADAPSIEGFSRIWLSSVGEELGVIYPALLYGTMTMDEAIQRLDACVADAA